MNTLLTLFTTMLISVPSIENEDVILSSTDSLDIKTENVKAKKAKKAKKELKYNEKGEIIKTGINLGPLPVIAFDNDRGFQFGALLNIYQFGDGSTYPNPKSSWYIEASGYTKGSYKFVLEYTNKSLIPGVRWSTNAGYYNDQALDFYGFNGFQSVFSTDVLNTSENAGFGIEYLDNKKGNKLAEKNKVPMSFYRHSRQLVKFKTDFCGEIVRNFFWEAGYNFNWFKTGNFQPKESSGYRVYSPMPTETDPDNKFYGSGDGIHSLSLYDIYSKAGIITPDHTDKKGRSTGNFVSAVRVGLRYDSRNVEKNPTKGIWATAHMIMAPRFLGTSDPYYRYNITMRQYIPLGTEKVIFAYRAAYTGYITGKNASVPWYTLPFYTNMGDQSDQDGFGGYRTLRGMKLNRLQGRDVVFYNAEIRYRFISFKLWKQNISFAISAFNDGGSVILPYKMPGTENIEDVFRSNSPMLTDTEIAKYSELYRKFVKDQKQDGYHGSAGVGLRFIMNENFIVAFEYAHCFNKQDGNGAFYLNTGFLF